MGRTPPACGRTPAPKSRQTSTSLPHFINLPLQARHVSPTTSRAVFLAFFVFRHALFVAAPLSVAVTGHPRSFRSHLASGRHAIQPARRQYRVGHGSRHHPRGQRADLCQRRGPNPARRMLLCLRSSHAQGKHHIAIKGRVRRADCPGQPILRHLRQFARLRLGERRVRRQRVQSSPAFKALSLFWKTAPLRLPAHMTSAFSSLSE